MDTPLSAPGRPVRSVLLGHSYIRRLGQFMLQDEYRNLQLPFHDITVECFGRGGATLRQRDDDHWIYAHLQSALSCRPSVVFIHVGENDLQNLSSKEIADQLWGLVTSVISHCHPQVIIVSQLLWFPRYEDRLDQITQANVQLSEYVDQHNQLDQVTKVEVLRHQFGVWGINRHTKFQADGTHLTDAAMRKYFYSIRNSIGSHVQRLLSQ